jgi:peptidoglycan/xylan/chitin deacetylase (PgdA/CDA1 family)
MANPVVLIVGRLSGPKNEMILSILRHVAPRVLQQIPKARFQVLGGPVAEEHFQLQKEAGSIRFEGHQKNLKPFYQKAAVVIGAGRVALEAMSLKKPVIAIGERMYIGPLTPQNVETAKATNFGDCWDREVFDWAQMGRDLVTLLKDKKVRKKVSQTGFELVQSEYNLKTLFPKMEALYARVLLEKNLSSSHELPILMYHRVVKKEPAFSKFNTQITQADMEKQFQFLKDRGFETIGFEDLPARRIPPKPIILTFDDGYEDNYHYLLPLLEKHRMKAVVYLLGNRRHLNNFWDRAKGEAELSLLKEGQVRAMQKSGLVEFGAHSMNHTDLTKAGPREIEREVAGSKKALEHFLKKPVISFAYPYGFVNEGIKKITAEAGFTFGVAVNTGPTRIQDDLMEIRRVHMQPNTSLAGFFKKTSGFYLRYRQFKKNPFKY